MIRKDVPFIPRGLRWRFSKLLYSMTSPHVAITLKKFDVFSRNGKATGWSYTGSIEAKSQEQAKQLFLKENNHLKAHQLAVYLKR